MIGDRLASCRPELLEAFAAVAETGSFTAAARMLGLRQSTVSQQIKRLEEETGRRLLDRDTHRVQLTPVGEVVLEHARRILDAGAQLRQDLDDTAVRGRLRFGASEDFVLSGLPDVLAAFVRRHPEIDLEVSAGLSEDLYRRYESGALDMLLVKRHGRLRPGETAWREPAAWVGRPGLAIDGSAPLPLLLYPQPSITRAMALETLEQARRRWRTAFTSSSLTALTAAGRAGIGIMPHSARLIPPGLAVLDHPALPPLGALEFVMVGAEAPVPAVQALANAIRRWSEAGRMRAPDR